jgi:uncharacterized protein
VRSPRALVTGASSGIGLAFVERLAAESYGLVLVARRRERLDLLAKRLREERHVDVEVAPADLTRADELGAVERRISEGPALDLLVNNAGFGGYRAFAEIEPDVAEQLIRLHVLAVTRLTRAALPGMIARRRGAVVNVSSLLAFSASLQGPFLPRRAVYAGAKAYINAFTEILANELAGTGVRAQVLCPGVVRTEFHEIQGIDPKRFPEEIVSKPDDVVEASLAGLRSGEVVCIPGLDDLSLVTEVREAQGRLFERSRTGTIASRYRSS